MKLREKKEEIEKKIGTLNISGVRYVYKETDESAEYNFES